MEPFTYDVRPAFRALRGLLGGAAAAVLAAGGLAGRAPALGLLPLAAAFLAASGLLTWAPGLERWYAAPGPTATANVAGRRRARGPRRLSLVLLAHHDSKSQNLPMLVRGALTTAAVGGSIALAACLALAAGGSQEAAGPAFGVAGATAACLLVLATLTSGNRSPGGVDNAGSVAALLALARRLPGAAPAEVELIFLSPGAEEDHMVGAMRWLAAHRAELAAAPAWALNLDGLGAPGRVALLERYGAGRWFSRELSAKARRAAAHLGLGVRGVWLPPAMGVDAIPFAHRGVPCLTLATGSLGRAILAVHSARDVAANLDPAALAAGIALAGEVAREVWEGGQARGGGPAEPGPGPPRAGSVRN